MTLETSYVLNVPPPGPISIPPLLKLTLYYSSFVISITYMLVSPICLRSFFSFATIAYQ